MKVTIYNSEKNKVGEMSVPDKFFGAQWNADLVHQAVVAHEANARNIVAHAKTRAEVSGGGKKPWKQKGTGRSRHGSIRSPLWIGGGATHGPLKEKIYAKKINKKMKLAALYSVLSQKLQEEKLFIIDSLPVSIDTALKTKEIKPIVKSFFGNASGLVVSSVDHKQVHKALRNIPRTSCMSAVSLNAYEALKARTIVFEKSAIEEFLKRVEA
jgi:large subunit ribosomal protein L4